ncbi:ATPase, AAA domain containing protein [Acanthamoeba castellanii str. Neff]|uniref:ATPase, AAA domain containing protein n=1 Tax=Acanthamoeba castellanii (strain ATCC 30010 / Neff) TaxID=1257118 RepID=L8GJ22_ACACF|nr:ATPase, AAA domain containing protein [Acanthamoeba castellanii str. Neff]ELR12161.1 ATPase, AAA domain containing protein [Acanthamoeba castellanii str. Neff]
MEWLANALGLLQSQVVAGGLAVLLLGWLFAHVRTGAALIADYLTQKVVVSVEVTQREEAFDWILQWLAQQPKSSFASHNYRHMLFLLSSLGPMQRFRRQQKLEVVSKSPPQLKYLPGQGLHLLWWRGSLIWVTKTRRSQPEHVTNMNGQTQVEPGGVLVLSTLGRSLEPIDSLVKSAMEASRSNDQGCTVIYNVDASFGGWKRAITKPERSVESVILDSDVAEELLQDAKEFLTSADWYTTLGIPYRRAYLFHGKPGCGKTSFVAAMAAKLGFSVCVLNLSEKNLNDSSLNMWLVEAPQNSIILLEDVDVAFLNQDRSSKKSEGKSAYEDLFGRPRTVTFSGLLNAIDGIASQEGRLFVMTTNHMEHLDPALIRPGRVDKVVHFGLASMLQVERMFLRFYPGEEALARQFAQQVGEGKVSMAMLQGYFMAHKKDPLRAAGSVSALQEQVDKEEEAERRREQAARRRREEEEEEELDRVEREREERARRRREREERRQAQAAE